VEGPFSIGLMEEETLFRLGHRGWNEESSFGVVLDPGME